VTHADGLTRTIERYYDAAPRSDADAEPVGPFTLFVGRGGWAYYARPRLGLRDEVRRGDVRALLARQRELDVPAEIEWQPAVTPSLADAARGAGMVVHEFRVLVHAGPAAGLPADVRLVDPADDIEAVLSAQQQGFGGLAEVEAAAVRTLRTRMAAGLTRVAVGFAHGCPVCVGMHSPVGNVTEVVGVSTLSSARRQGWAGRVTTALLADAYAHGVETVFLSAADDAVARVYRRVGFADAGGVCAAELPPGSAGIANR
jgi:ribosomal protein S18 acetylase RimI-like enzyme